MSVSSTAPSSGADKAGAAGTRVATSSSAARRAALLAPRLLGTRGQWIGLGVGVLALLAFWLTAADNWIAVINAILVYALATLALNVLSGYTGQVSLGIFFFMAIGGFTAAILSAQYSAAPDAQVGFGLPFYIWLPAAGVAAAVVGALIGPIALRLTGFYLGIVSLALLYVGEYFAHDALPATLTGKHSGRFLGPITIGTFSFSSPQPNDVGGILITDEQAYFILLVVIVAICGLFVANVMRSRAGRAMQAVRDNETAAAIMGVNLFQTKMGAFILSSFLAGLAGALYASSTLGGLAQVPDLPDAGLLLSIEIVAAIIVGGIASVWGSILGAAFVFAIPLVLNKLSPVSLDANSGFIVGSLETGIFGLFIIVFLLLEPAGVVGLFRRGRLLRLRLAMRRRAEGGEAAQTPP